MTTAQFVQDDVALQFWVRFAAEASFKEFATFCCPRQIVCTKTKEYFLTSFVLPEPNSEYILT